MKKLILKETFIYILIPGKASKLVLHFFDPEDNQKALGKQASQAALAAPGRCSPWCTQQSVPASTASHMPTSFPSYPDQKVAPGYFFILLDSFITEILLWQFPPILRSFEVSSQNPYFSSLFSCCQFKSGKFHPGL